MESEFDFIRAAIAATPARLPVITWFAHVGQPIADPAVPRMGDWDAWGGPEEETGAIIALSLPPPGLA